jgi:two-component system, chemotaxis family, sensor kinase Cph1
LTPKHHQALKQYLASDSEPISPLQLQFAQDRAKRLFNTTIHHQDGSVILELEPVDAEQPLSFGEFYQTIKAPLERLQQSENLEQLSQVAVAEIKRLTQFDRVMVYRFLPDGSGSVIAEAVSDGAESYLGLRYPASDIPKQARQLYTLNWLRVIPTIDYTPIPLVPEINPYTQQPLDLSQTVLRSVSPVHLEYLANMGVQASMSISLLQDRQPWGLIACHHNRDRAR